MTEHRSDYATDADVDDMLVPVSELPALLGMPQRSVERLIQGLDRTPFTYTEGRKGRGQAVRVGDVRSRLAAR